ncbi:[FeFe] hydrogenase H-cluster radical SAM maturase HydG [Shewanella fidelis]|uniref:[FeFe] hydrogenase H-cluster radical SAM maturase HydG n=1 Tax=Shewanella fidelis TaxID=173509 RepID=A0AAW8NIJ0_9GAMM|nr:[FeFe] hydrogenase H-cluster radical SAM maturase HydG [Shewanella fidelis]MDR8523148.1 [FeFe] hydrogenase H-cluster radical SAM maturase HydG [Shewanella fidelis]MDW4811526.1 [FeFe] hydrogenase H-cluster radical SAM maturase HydG [Shewanella fidelis]MDW4815647.1 [FeFe] hydrogenase H-cluster radical SAM maturase HydG [Shewanella fidelis]MDW4819737.1 [FeFe] hydrogenase H-cluster radical SAM maturase HydG [Shewanella fidelis]MDW4824289.1 [FeFe] hydrogenase H-cluster radical SAM maturase HydG 
MTTHEHPHTISIADYNANKSFIDEQAIWSVINNAANPSAEQVRQVLVKAKQCQGLSIEETAILLQNQHQQLDEELFAVAREIKNTIYGNRIVLFAPLYVSNHCANSCSYCGFNADNHQLKRKTLNHEEIEKEVAILEAMGHKRILAVYGEHPRNNVTAIVDSIRTMYSVKDNKGGEIRRINVNCAPMSTDDFKTLKTAAIGTYQCFQETYHQPTYESVHLKGKKKDYLYRLYAMHRAMEAGIDDVGIGALFGLYDHRFELLAMLKHVEELETVCGIGPHTISFPRIEPAHGSAISEKPPYEIDDACFKRIVAITRLAVPYTGLIMSTRESAALRKELLELGVSQISAGSRTSPGGYQDSEHEHYDAEQFSLGDHRAMDDIIYELVTESNAIPSFCTGCYRKGRTGDHFIGLAKQQFIGKFCQPNALITFKEYLNDYASEKTSVAGNALIESELAAMSPARERNVRICLAKTDSGERDIYL